MRNIFKLLIIKTEGSRAIQNKMSTICTAVVFRPNTITKLKCNFYRLKMITVLMYLDTYMYIFPIYGRFYDTNMNNNTIRFLR